MLNPSIKALSIGATLVLAASGAWGQTSSTHNPPMTTIGVTPQDAQEATQQAVPRSDTGTLIRTEPSAAERAREMSESASEGAREMAEDAKDAVTPDTRSGTSSDGTVDNTSNHLGNPASANPSSVHRPETESN